MIQNRTIPATFTPIASATASTQGRWGALFANPVVAIHMHLLPTGKVLLWGHKGDAELWDATSGFSPATKTYRAVLQRSHAAERRAAARGRRPHR